MRALPSAAILLLSNACVMQRVTTEVRIRDPGQVALASDSGAVVVPAGSAPSQAVLTESRADTGEGSSTGFTVQARREDDRSITVDWDTKLPVANGERATVVPADGLLSFKGPASALVTPEMLDSPSFAAHWCTELASHGYHRSSSYVVEARGCANGAPEGIASAGYQLSMPWDNVEIVEHVRPDHGGATMIIALATLSFGAFAALMFSFPAHDFTGGAPTKYALAFSDIGIALSFDVPMLWTLFAPDRDTVVRHR